MTTAGRAEYTEIVYEKGDWVARITLNRAGAYNAYTSETLGELAAAFRAAAFDDEVGVIVYTGAGVRAFCTGGDVKEYERRYTRAPHEYWKYMGLFRAYLESILDAGKPVIARLNGMAVGGGNESHLACDLSVMAEHAYVGQVGTGVGSVAAGGGTQWLPLFVGDRRARWMLMLNRKIGAYQALEWGLVNEVVPSVTKDGVFIVQATPEQIRQAQAGEGGYGIDLGKLDEAVDGLCQELLDKFAECTRYTKAQVNFWKELAWHQTIGHAREWLALHFATMEPLEGMSAFVEKRAPGYRRLRGVGAGGGAPEFPWGPYARACGVCGAQHLPEGFEYCGQCGAALGGDGGSKEEGSE